MAGVLVNCSARKIEMTDGLLGKSDPFLKIYPSDGVKPNGPLIWQTEYIHNTRTPVWEAFPFYYDLIQGDMTRPIVVQVYDYENHGNHEFIAQLNLTAGEFLTPGSEFQLYNRKKKKKLGYKHSGYIKMNSVVQLTPDNDPYHGSGYLTAPQFSITLKASGLDAKDVLGKSDPYFVIEASPVNLDGSKRPPFVIARSEVVKQKLNCTWSPVVLDNTYCHALDPLTIYVYDYDDDLNNDFIGKTSVTSLHELRMGKLVMPLINEKKVGNMGYKNSGTIVVTDFSVNWDTPPVYQSFSITLSAKRLARRDTFGDPDPYLSLKAVPFHYISYPGHPHIEAMHPDQLPPEHRPKPVEVYRSEYYKNVKKPNFQEFRLNVHEVGGITGNIILELWDLDVKSEDDLIGRITTNLAELMTPNLELGVKSPDSHHHGCQGIVRVDSIIPSTELHYSTFQPKDNYTIQFKAEKVARMDSGLTKNSRNSDPYLIFIGTPYGAFDHVEILRTPYIGNARNCEWDPLQFNTGQCGGLDTPITIICMDYDQRSKDDKIGTTTLTLRQMHRLYELQSGVPLLRKESKRKKNFGMLYISYFG